MSVIRQQHWYWLSGVCLVAGLSAWWSPSWTMREELPVREQVVRRRIDLPPPTGEQSNVQQSNLKPVANSPFHPVKQLAVPAPEQRLPEIAPFEHPQPRLELSAPSLSLSADPLVPPSHAPRLGVPESVWLTGSIETSESRQ